MKIAVMNASVAQPLIEHVDEVCAELGWNVVRASDADCSRMLLNNEVSLALVSPLGYGRGVGRVDYRLVPGPCVVLTDYTETAGVVFSEGVEEITAIAATEPKSFMAVMGFIILREKFDSTATTIDQANAESMCVITDQLTERWTLDISEEWYDLAETPLPAALWVCRTEAELDKVADAVKRMQAANLVEHDVVEHSDHADETFPRNGRISYEWNDEVQESLDAVLNVLFFHQQLAELPAIKILGRDEL